MLKRSARNPPHIENKIKGKENNAAVTGTKALCICSESARFRPKKTTRVFRALSLKAPPNCVMIRLQKPFRFEPSEQGSAQLLSVLGAVIAQASYADERIYARKGVDQN